MEARYLVGGRFLRLILALAIVLAAAPAWAGSARTKNFIVTAGTQELAHEIAVAAENFRRDLAVEWLDKELPDWEQPCPIRVTVDPRMGAGGATSFMFANGGRGGPGRPHGWTMSIQGSRERVLDSVLPHEVTHTIFATHFGRPLPRWADEGACTTVEHHSERGKQEKLLYQFLTTNRGIAFNKMFAMKEYPQDILPLYSQGYALARYLIALGGKPKFVGYVGAGMDSGDWTTATKKFYGFHTLSDLQLSWVEWVKKGTPAFQDAGEVRYVSTDPARNGRTLADVIGEKTSPVSLASLERSADAPRAVKQRVAPLSASSTKVAHADADSSQRVPANTLPREPQVKSNDGWYSRIADEARAKFGGHEQPAERVTTLPSEYRDRPDSSAEYTSRARPQPPEQVKQTLLEWKKDQRGFAPAGP